MGILWIIYSLLHLLPGIFLLAFFGLRAPWARIPWEGQHPHPLMFVGPFVAVIGLFLLAGAALGLVTGWGLLGRKSWARVLALVLGCLALLNIPFGTALGIYTLWVLMPRTSENEYRRLAT